MLVSDTSRPQREGEVPGYDYYFVKRSTVKALYDQGAFIEMGEYRGNLYGTTEGSVREVAQRKVNNSKQLTESFILP